MFSWNVHNLKFLILVHFFVQLMTIDCLDIVHQYSIICDQYLNAKLYPIVLRSTPDIAQDCTLCFECNTEYFEPVPYGIDINTEYFASNLILQLEENY